MSDTPGIDRELGRLQKRLGETASGNKRQRDAIESRMDMLRKRAGYANEEKQQAAPDRITELERKINALQRSISTGRFVSELILARKATTNNTFNELTVPDDASTTLAPIVSGGRAAVLDTDPLAPLDLGQDDWLLVEVPTQNKTRTVRVAGGAVRNMRYIQTPIHAFQITFKANPTVDADWVTVVELDPCTTTAPRTGNIFNPLGLGSDAFLFEENPIVNLSGPITITKQITTGDTTTNGAGATEIVAAGANSYTVFRINAFATSSTKKGQIRLFISFDSGTTKFWIGSIDVAATDSTGIGSRFTGSWIPDDPVNGLICSNSTSIYASTYETDTFNITAIGSSIA